MGGESVQMSDQLLADGLTLHVLTMSDLVELHEIFSDPLTHTIGDGPISDVEYTRGWLQRREALHATAGLAWYGVRLVDGSLIGNAGLFTVRAADEPELGFEIRASHQSRGFGSRAAAAVVAEAHSAGHARVWATVRPANLRSMKSLSRIGFSVDHKGQDERGELVFLLHTEE